MTNIFDRTPTSFPSGGLDTPDAPAFYVTGGTLPTFATSYVARQADEALLSALRRGEFAYVLNTRQMGKSSLMVRTAAMLREGGAAVAVLDLTSVGQNLTVAQWYNGLLERIGQQLRLEDALEAFWETHRNAGPMQRFLAALAEVALPALAPRELVVFVDEIDVVRSLPFATDELFAGIRELYNRRTIDPELKRLTFCLLGVASPADLIRDTRTTPFNIGTRVDLTDFTPSEAAPLTRGMVGGAAVLSRVLYWTGGHPYLTQRLCRAVADEPAPVTAAGVDMLCRELFLTKRARETEDNLLFIRERVLRTDIDLAALLTLYGRILRGDKGVADDPADPLASALKLAGLVKGDQNGRLAVRNRIYARVFDRAWVRENMPGAELRRQRAAFRRGAWRVGAFAAVVIFVIGTLGLLAWREAREAKRQTGIARTQAMKFEKLLYVSDMQNAQSAWDHDNLGRLRGLLDETKASPERGFEWGYWNRLAYPSGDVVNPGDGPLLAGDITRDGTKLLTAGGNGMLRVWDARALRPVVSVHFPGLSIANAGFNIEGTRFDATDQSGAVAVYATATGKLLKFINPHTSTLNTASPDMKTIEEIMYGVAVRFVPVDGSNPYTAFPFHGGTYSFINANDSEKTYFFKQRPTTASIYSYDSGRLVCNLKITGPDLASDDIDGSFTNDDDKIITISSPSNRVCAWDASTGQFLRLLTVVPLHADHQVMVSPYTPLAMIFAGGRLLEFSTESWRKLLDVPLPVKPAAYPYWSFTQDGRELGLGETNGSIVVLNCKTGQITGKYLGHSSEVNGVLFQPHSSRFFSVSNDGTLRGWNVDQPAQNSWRVAQFPHASSNVSMLAVNHLASAISEDQQLSYSIWSIEKNHAKLITATKPSSHAETATSSDSAFLLTYPGWWAVYRVYDLSDGRLIGTGGNPNEGGQVGAVSDDGQSVAFYTGKDLMQIYNVSGNRLLWSEKGSNNASPLCCFSPSSQLVACGGSDGIIDVWDVGTGRKVNTLLGTGIPINALTILPGDRYLVADTSDQMLHCWDIASGRILWTVQNPLGLSTAMTASPDGSRLLTESGENGIGIWDAQSGDLLLTNSGPNATAYAQFSADGSRLDLSDPSGGYTTLISDMADHGGNAIASASK